VRAAIVTVGLAVLAGISIAVTWVVAVSGATAGPQPRSAAIVASNPRSSSASRADGSTRVELPWLLAGDTGAAVSPDGGDLAFSSARTGSTEIYVADTRTGIVRRLTGNTSSDDVEPAWSPDGRQLTWASGSSASHDLVVMGADGSHKTRLVEGAANDVEPAWSPDGGQIAFASNRDGRYRLWVVSASGGEPTTIVDAPGQMRSPAWSPIGSALAYTGAADGNADVWIAALDGSAPKRVTTAPGFDGRPDWAPDGRRVAFVSNRGGAQRIWLMGADGSGQRALGRSESGDDTPDWSVVDEAMSPALGSLLPDLDQQAPSGILVMKTAGRTRLGFTSAVDNIGDGPIHILGTRVGAARTMRADQLIHLRNGTLHIVREIGRLAYEPHPPHFHWHLEPYESYELRRASDDAFVARDGKSGFCLLDRWGYALRRPGTVRRPPRFVGDCAALRPEARRVDEGSSVGFTDRYPGFFHGQDIDISGLEPGLYVLVHRANPERRIRELRYSNNAASALIRISEADASTGVPTATIVRRCPASDHCQAG
jgi:Tol biopolymer transport system component